MIIDFVKSISHILRSSAVTAQGFEKNPHKLEENLKIIDGWIKDAKALMTALNS